MTVTAPKITFEKGGAFIRETRSEVEAYSPPKVRASKARCSCI